MWLEANLDDSLPRTTMYALLTNLTTTVTEDVLVWDVCEVGNNMTDFTDFSSGFLHFLKVTASYHILK